MSRMEIGWKCVEVRGWSGERRPLNCRGTARDSSPFSFREVYPNEGIKGERESDEGIWCARVEYNGDTNIRCPWEQLGKCEVNIAVG